MENNLNENGQEMVINMTNLGFNTPQPILITFTNPINGQHLGEFKEVDGVGYGVEYTQGYARVIRGNNIGH